MSPRRIDDDEDLGYATESEASVRARRRRRKALTTLAILLLGLFFAFWWAYSYYKASEHATSGARPTASPTPTCLAVDPKAVTPSSVTVNVLNATTRKGLAGATAKEFTAQGFLVGKVANDTSKKQIPGPGEVRFGAKGQAQADLVLKVLGQGATAAQDGRKDATVDVALGEGFVKLQPLPTPSLPPCPSAPAPAASPTK